MGTATDNIQELIKKEVEAQLAEIKSNMPEDKVSLIVFSGDFDKAMAAFMMATGAAAMGMEVTMFFTFWGCSVIKKKRKLSGKKFLHKMVNIMLPANSRKLNPSQMAFGPIGRNLFRYMMKGKMQSLEQLIDLAKELGIKFIVCAPSLEVMGFDKDEWIVPAEIGGVAAMYETALKSKTAYFI
ncbi:MAG: DsrE/DsrF/DrsH-like family protein [Spirochaetota bacterium]|nr:DsrE/DsrF/DrsH-like family protein [Spirochaetota bacterium]